MVVGIMVDWWFEVRFSFLGLFCFSIFFDGFCDFFLLYNGNVFVRRRRYFDVKVDVLFGNFYLILFFCVDVYIRYWWFCIWFIFYFSF